MEFDNGYALLIGTASEREIAATANDAIAIEKILQNHAHYPFKNILTLTKQNATKARITNGFKWLEEKVEEVGIQSTVIIYYAGHGDEPKDGYCDEYHLRPYDFDQDPPKTLITASELNEMIKKITAGKLIFFLNSCHAGGITSEAISLGGPVQSNKTDQQTLINQIQRKQREFIELLDKGAAKIIISASRASEKSYLKPGSDHTIFGEHLMDALKGAGSDQREKVILSDIENYLDYKVRESADELGRDQEIYKKGETSGQIVISINVHKDLERNDRPEVTQSLEIHPITSSAGAGREASESKSLSSHREKTKAFHDFFEAYESDFDNQPLEDYCDRLLVILRSIVQDLSGPDKNMINGEIGPFHNRNKEFKTINKKIKTIPDLVSLRDRLKDELSTKIEEIRTHDILRRYLESGSRITQVESTIGVDQGREVRIEAEGTYNQLSTELLSPQRQYATSRMLSDDTSSRQQDNLLDILADKLLQRIALQEPRRAQ